MVTNQPKTQDQGTVIVEKDGGDGFLVMFPNGDLRQVATKAAVIDSAKRWFEKHLDGTIGIGRIEWRGVTP